jgi:hypothetical protein
MAKVTMVLGEATLSVASLPLRQACEWCRALALLRPVGGFSWPLQPVPRGGQREGHPNHERKRFRFVAALRRVWLLELVGEGLGVLRLSRAPDLGFGGTRFGAGTSNYGTPGRHSE